MSQSNEVAHDNRIIETDLLIIGGGIAGCLAAIRARKMKVDVTLVDKGSRPYVLGC